MSVTTSTNTVTRSVLQVLTDYDLHHSGAPDHPAVPEGPNTRSNDLIGSHQPEGWPSDHRRIPAHRPIDRNLDLNERPGGSNAVEAVFIFTMLNGCGINSNISRLWRATGGKLNDHIFRYDIGGEK